LASGADAAHHARFKDADKYCKAILGRVSRGYGCVKSVAFAVVAMAVGAAIMSSNMESLDWKKFSVVFSSPQSF
jgi:hypothetical protein